MAFEIKITGDGSPTIYLPHLDEHYHSTHGATQESMHVFIRHGLLHKIENGEKEFNILEIGFGTGLNLLLTFRENINRDCRIYYEALEPFPLPEEIIQKIHFSIPGIDNVALLYQQVHHLSFDEIHNLSINTQLKKTKITLEDFTPRLKYNLIYFDAFGPRVQPDIWSLLNFKKLFDNLMPGGVLVTYCAKGEVRRIMQAAGFHIEKLAGPPGKREMLRATKLH